MALTSREIYWSAILADFRRSRLTHVEFCHLRRISLHSFRKWLYHLRPGLPPKVTRDRDDQIFYATMLALALPFLVVGVVLTVRRLRDAGWPLWLVLFFFATHADQHRLFHRAVSYAESGTSPRLMERWAT